MTPVQYEKKYPVHVYDIGSDGKLNPHSLFNYLQDIAAEHAVRLRFGKDDLMKENKFWVLSRIAADIILWPEWENTLTVRTWPRGTDRLFALRDFKVTLADGRHVGSATSSWLVVDRTTRKVQRPDTVLTHLNSEFPAETALGINAPKVELTDKDADLSESFRIKTSDLDINMHTNNVMYVKWAFDCYDASFRESNLPSKVVINYLAESRLNDEIRIRTMCERKNESYIHSVIRYADNVEICRVRIGWTGCHH